MKPDPMLKHFILLLLAVLGLQPLSATNTAGFPPVDETISGTILDDDTGEPLFGATVQVLGTLRGTTTDFDGRFSVEVESLPATLAVSFTGYAPQEILVSSTAPIEIRLVTGLDIDEVVVTGSRGRARTIMESPVPIDNINAAELLASGQPTIDQMLNMKVPSYNSTQQTISDATAHFDPSELRNLGPSRTLVLVNGKRKNQSAQVYLNETPGRGEVGVDMKSIPAAAIERIEVLRDGASPQYGSDAIAGVINIVLKERTEEALVNLETGVTTEGDGFMYSADINKGFTIGNGGFLNLTGSFYHQDHTDRAGEPGGDGLFGFLYDIGAIPIEAAGGFEATPGNVATGRQILNGDTDWQRANPDLGMIVGQPEYDKASIYANLGIPHSGGEFYINGGYTYRDGTSFALYRAPYWPGISSDPANNPLSTPGQAYQGFQPTFESDINDVLITVGNTFNAGDWGIDLSATTGSNSVDYLIGNSFNTTLGGSSPTSFDPGGYTFGNLLGNLDVSRSWDNVDFGIGIEARRENYEVRAGQEESYIGAGAQSFPGLQPDNALEADRTNVGAYLSLDFEATDALLLGGALRYENYSDFGSNFSWKFNARHLLGDKGTIRGSVSTGFRAPSLHQIYLSNIQTLVVDGNIAQEGTFNNVSDVTRNLLGIPQLDAEESFNYTAGITYRLTSNFSASVDYYNVQVDNRVLFSNQISSSALPEGNPVRDQLSQSGVESFKFFVNALDTRTSGVDVVLSYENIYLGSREKILGLLFALNANETKIEGEVNAPQVFSDNNIEIFNREEKARVTSARPNLKFNFAVDLDLGKLNVNLNNTYFGDVTWRHPANPAFDQTFSSKVLTDLIVGYDVTDNFGLAIIVNNLLDVYPDEINTFGDFETDLGGRFRYPWEVNQFGFMGTVAKLRVNFRF